VDHVALHDVCQRPQKSLESIALKAQALARSGGDNVGCSHFISQQSSFTKILSGLVLKDFLGFSMAGNRFGSIGLTCYNKIELVADVSLPDNELSSIKIFFFECVTKFAAFVVVHRLKDAHSFQEVFELFVLFPKK